MKHADISRTYAFRLGCLADSVRQLFKRRHNVDVGFYCVHAKDASGEFVHFLCRKRSHDGDDQVAR